MAENMDFKLISVKFAVFLAQLKIKCNLCNVKTFKKKMSNLMTVNFWWWHLRNKNCESALL